MSQLLKLPRPTAADPGLSQLIDTLERGDPWREMTYNEFTSNVTVTVTAEATAITVVTADELDCDGKPVLIEFGTPRLDVGAGGVVQVNLWDGATNLGYLGVFALAGANGGCTLQRRLTPTVGAHTYHVKANAVTAAGAIYGGAGGAGAYLPGFIRTMRA